MGLWQICIRRYTMKELLYHGAYIKKDPGNLPFIVQLFWEMNRTIFVAQAYRSAKEDGHGFVR